MVIVVVVVVVVVFFLFFLTALAPLLAARAIWRGGKGRPSMNVGPTRSLEPLGLVRSLLLDARLGSPTTPPLVDAIDALLRSTRVPSHAALSKGYATQTSAHHAQLPSDGHGNPSLPLVARPTIWWSRVTQLSQTSACGRTQRWRVASAGAMSRPSRHPKLGPPFRDRSTSLAARTWMCHRQAAD